MAISFTGPVFTWKAPFGHYKDSYYAMKRTGTGNPLDLEKAADPYTTRTEFLNHVIYARGYDKLGNYVNNFLGSAKKSGWGNGGWTLIYNIPKAAAGNGVKAGGWTPPGGNVSESVKPDILRATVREAHVQNTFEFEDMQILLEGRDNEAETIAGARDSCAMGMYTAIEEGLTTPIEDYIAGDVAPTYAGHTATGEFPYSVDGLFASKAVADALESGLASNKRGWYDAYPVQYNSTDMAFNRRSNTTTDANVVNAGSDYTNSGVSELLPRHLRAAIYDTINKSGYGPEYFITGMDTFHIISDLWEEYMRLNGEKIPMITDANVTLGEGGIKGGTNGGFMINAVHNRPLITTQRRLSATANTNEASRIYGPCQRQGGVVGRPAFSISTAKPTRYWIDDPMTNPNGPANRGKFTLLGGFDSYLNLVVTNPTWQAVVRGIKKV